MSRNNQDLAAYYSFLRNKNFSCEAIYAMQKIAGDTEKNWLKFLRNGEFAACKEFYDTLDALDYLNVDLPEIDRVPSVDNLRDLALIRLNELKEKFNIVFAVADLYNKHVVIYLPSLNTFRKVAAENNLWEILDD